MPGNELLLGPIVGHTDTASSRVWIRVSDEPREWSLLIDGRSLSFEPTDPENNEFGTAIAFVSGLEAGRDYAYSVSKAGRSFAEGSLRTMPDATSTRPITYVALSCNAEGEAGAWPQLEAFARAVRPAFVLMTGDQVYLDAKEGGDIWQTHPDAPRKERRQAMAAKYQAAWSSRYLAGVLANVPTYMTWDDHDVRNGWGSFAGDSPSLASRHPRGREIHAGYRAYFEDALNVYYHFQACRNPSSSLPGSVALPYSFRCGPLQIIVLDTRAERDFARPEAPVLGEPQWRWLEEQLHGLQPEVESLAVVTGEPLVDLDPDGLTHRFFRRRSEDIDVFRRGDGEALEALRHKKDSSPLLALALFLGSTVDRDFRFAKLLKLGASALDGARDRWSHAANRPEQSRLIRLLAAAASAGRRPDGRPRSLSLLGGDIHMGALFDVQIESPRVRAQCLVSSGISTRESLPWVTGVIVDESLTVDLGIEAHLECSVRGFNFAFSTLRRENGSWRLTSAFVQPPDDA